MKSFTFLVHNIYHMGGTTKSISNLANILKEKGHTVKIISVFKASEQPYFNLHEKIEIEPIIEYGKTIKGLQHILFNRINKFTPLLKPKYIHPSEPGLNQFSSYVEKKIIQKIKEVDTDIIIGTRASYNLLVAQYAKSDIFKIGMEHMYLKAHDERYQQDIVNAYRKLDVVTTLTKEDQHDYQTQLSHTKVIIVPNIIKETTYNLEKKNTIVAAGRFEKEKGFDLLIESIRNIADKMREKQYVLDIYGDGQEKDALNALINNYQLNDLIQLKPTTNHLSKVLSSSKITAVPSRIEGFGLVILEAMYQNSIVVSYKGCYGPEYLIDENLNGFLAERENSKDFANHLGYIIDHYENNEIQSMIKNAQQKTSQFADTAIYNQFIKDIQISK